MCILSFSEICNLSGYSFIVTEVGSTIVRYKQFNLDTYNVRAFLYSADCDGLYVTKPTGGNGWRH